MFRFTIRDLLWLTVVVGLTMGWTLRERQLSGEAENWRLKTGALEQACDVLGYDIKWGKATVEVRRKTDIADNAWASTRHHEPSAGAKSN